MVSESIYTYIKEQEARFETEEIRVGRNWNWNFKTHVQLIFHMKNSRFYSGQENTPEQWLRSYKNIMEPILNLAYWTEDIEVKDIVFYVEQENGRVLSFLVKKYHDEVYLKKNNIDTLLDEIAEDDIDYGGVLVQKGEKTPEVVFLPSIAFCDQTDILGGPLGFKFNFSPDKLRQMAKKGWGDEKFGATISIDEVITLAENQKDTTSQTGAKKNDTTGKNIEVYIVKGSLPEHYLKDNDNMDDWYNQVHIIGYYVNDKEEKQGVTLFRMKESESSLKFHTSKKVYSRALGRGFGEMLLDPQIWTNFAEIHKHKMLEAGAKVLPYTDDEDFSERNELADKDNLEMSKVADGKRIDLIPTVNPAAYQMFEASVDRMFEHAQALGSAFDPIMGKEQVSGTTFRGQERTVRQGRGLHDRRRGQRAKFVEEIYRDWIIPDIKKEILRGQKFLATLTSDEMDWVIEALAENKANRERVEQVLNGEIPTDKEELKQKFLSDLTKKGSRVLIEILKDEFRDVEIKMGINVAGKQKDLALMVDKILAIFQFVVSNPQGFQQVMQLPGMSTAFNDILELSGISPVDFANIAKAPALQQQPQQQAAQVPQTLTPKQPQNA